MKPSKNVSTLITIAPPRGSSVKESRHCGKAGYERSPATKKKRIYRYPFSPLEVHTAQNCELRQGDHHNTQNDES